MQGITVFILEENPNLPFTGEIAGVAGEIYDPDRIPLVSKIQGFGQAGSRGSITEKTKKNTFQNPIFCDLIAVNCNKCLSVPTNHD